MLWACIMYSKMKWKCKGERSRPKQDEREGCIPGGTVCFGDPVDAESENCTWESEPSGSGTQKGVALGGSECQPSPAPHQARGSETRVSLEFPFFFFFFPPLTALLSYNSHIIQCTHLKCTTQWFSVHPGPVQPSWQLTVGHFHQNVLKEEKSCSY